MLSEKCLLENGRQRCHQKSSAQCWRCGHIDLCRSDVQIIRPWSQFLPRWCQILTCRTPWCIAVLAEIEIKINSINIQSQYNRFDFKACKWRTIQSSIHFLKPHANCLRSNESLCYSQPHRWHDCNTIELLCKIQFSNAFRRNSVRFTTHQQN